MSKSRWRKGEFVRVRTDYPLNLAHRGDVGVVIERSAANYYRVWFGPGDGMWGDVRGNWRGYYGEWLEEPDGKH